MSEASIEILVIVACIIACIIMAFWSVRVQANTEPPR